MKRIHFSAFFFSLAVGVSVQAAAQDVPESAETLRSKIHSMRMNLLLGGERVRAAEGEAVQFYGDRLETIDRRLDSIEVDRSEQSAGYQVLLDRALSAKDPAARREAMAEAAGVRGGLTELELESTQLSQRRGELARLVTTVQARDRERERLVAQIEAASPADAAFGLPFTSIGLAPVTDSNPEGSPLDDDALIGDLLERDPGAARKLLFEMDPARYWRRFPLQPPRAALQRALPFPAPDLPGSR